MLRRLAVSCTAAVLMVTGGSVPLLDNGFAARAVTGATLAATLTADVDMLLVAGTLNPATPTAENRAAIVRGTTAAGNGVILIGTDPVWRLHAKGLQPQLGRAPLRASRR